MNRYLPLVMGILLLALVITLALLVRDNSNRDPNPPSSSIGTALYCERDPSGSVHCWER